MRLRRMLSAALAAGICGLVAVAQRDPLQAARLLRYSEVSDVIRASSELSQPEGNLPDAAAWDGWIRNRDRQIRDRIDRGTEDSISNLILYGTSYTTLPRLEDPEHALSANGELTKAARARVNALVMAFRHPENNERLRFARDFLIRRRILRLGAAAAQAKGSKGTRTVETFLSANLRRLASEQRAFQEKLRAASQANNPAGLFAARGVLFEKRGLSVDTSLLPNFALEDTLGALVRKGVLAPGSIRRIAIIGPGLDFSDKRNGYDFYPLQTIQPFAILDAVLRLRLSEPESVRVVTFDLNPFVTAHVKAAAARGRAGHPYVIQLPRNPEAGWNQESIAYWEHFGEIIGSTTRPLPAPRNLGNVTSRAVAVQPRYAARLAAVDLDIVAQTADPAPAEGFDLVIATNILVYYNRFEQSIAMSSVAHLMNPGGVFLANSVLPTQHPGALAYLGRRSVSYSLNGAYGDDVVVYRRQ